MMCLGLLARSRPDLPDASTHAPILAPWLGAATNTDAGTHRKASKALHGAGGGHVVVAGGSCSHRGAVHMLSNVTHLRRPNATLKFLNRPGK